MGLRQLLTPCVCYGVSPTPTVNLSQEEPTVEDTISNRINADRRGVLSSLWIFVLFNMLFRDIHESEAIGFDRVAT